MAFDENLAARIRLALARKKSIDEKRMFGCICFFLNGNALAGVWKDRLIARLGPDEGGSGSAGTTRPVVRHHRQGDEELGGGRAGGRRGRRPVEGVGRAGGEVRADAAEEVNGDIERDGA